MLALQHSGQYPAYNWIEVAYYDGIDEVVALAGTSLEKLELRLWKPLASLIPPGGHMMVEYECDRWASSRQALSVGIPPVLTPLGFLMLSIGVGHSYKDWYISEGGLEGGRKLQGYRALSNDRAVAAAETMRQEISDFLKAPRRPACADLEMTAIRLAPRAMAILRSRARKTNRGDAGPPPAPLDRRAA